MEDARTRRLRTDHEKVLALAARSQGALEIEKTVGEPPARYVLKLRCKGIARLEDGNPVFRDLHRMEIKIPSAYPLAPPYARMLTPVFHVHVFENQQICLGPHWVVGEGLDNLIVRIVAIIRGEPAYFDFASPANGEAAEWTREHLAIFPLQANPFTGEAVAEPVSRKRRVVWQDRTAT
jgi:ubiquitin-protein ligase